MKDGDIVYLIESHQALYCSVDGAEYFNFPLNEKYIVSCDTGNTCVVKLKSLETHFFSGDGYRKLINEKDYNNIKRKSILRKIIVKN